MAAATDVLVHLRKGVLQYCVLACLVPGPMYGRELAARLAAQGQLLESEGTLYPLLSRLRVQGLVETTWQESRTGPPRRYYELTEDGLAALETFARVWGPFRDAVDGVLEELA